MNKKMKAKLVIIVFILFLVGVAYFIMSREEVPYNISMAGKIYPLREWVIVRGNDGIILTTVTNNFGGVPERSSVHNFERGDAVQVNLNMGLAEEAEMAAGDTVGHIFSNMLTQHIMETQGELDIQKSVLAYSITGEKSSVIAEAENRVAYALAQTAEQENQVIRLERLYKNKFVPYQDFEIAKNTLETYKINVEIAKKQLASVQTGVKPEEQNMLETQIRSLKNTLRTLMELEKKYTLISPIKGTVLQIASQDTLIRIADIDTVIAVIPLKLSYRSLVKPGLDVECSIPGSNEMMKGKIDGIGNTTIFVNNNQGFMVKVILENKKRLWMPDTICECKLKFGSVPGKTFLNMHMKNKPQ